MRDDDLLEVELSAPPSAALRGVRAAAAAPLVAIALVSAGCDTSVIGEVDAGGYDARPTVNDSGLSYDAGRVDAPHDADPSGEEDAPSVDGGPPLDVG